VETSLIETEGEESPPTEQSSPAGAPGDRRDLITVHIGDEWTVSQEDLDLMLSVVQTVVLLAWVYTEMTD
jgi:hypothetical protein